MVLLIALCVGAVPVSAAVLLSHEGPVGDENIAYAEANPATDPKPIQGYVYTLGGLPVQGANVTVKMINGGTTVNTQWVDSTGADGFYGVTFEPNKWGIGWTIRVEATKAPDLGVNVTVCDAEFSQWVDVTLGLVIPEFSGYAPVFLAFVLVAVLAASSSKRARKAA